VKRLWIALILTIGLACLGLAQSYSPKSGETVLRLAFEGRGNVYILLHTKQAPRTTARIIELVNDGFYNGQKVFRAEKSPRPFMIQMGDPNTKTKGVDDASVGSGGSGVKIAYENSGFVSDEGAVGLATIPGDKNSGDSQFFILLSRARFLDGNYTVFGQVVAGMEVVKKIERGDRIVSATIIR
jgi:cyclophilin family peptidyl-prolyl cis-trans isomerase